MTSCWIFTRPPAISTSSTCRGVTNISNYVDLFFNHSNWWDNSNVLTITDGANSIQLDGYVGTDMLGLILDGHFTV